VPEQLGALGLIVNAIVLDPGTRASPARCKPARFARFSGTLQARALRALLGRRARPEPQRPLSSPERFQSLASLGGGDRRGDTKPEPVSPEDHSHDPLPCRG
jgi:hypothetical protein